MAFTKILDSDFSGKSVKGLPDTPGYSTAEMQDMLVAPSDQVLMPAINRLIDELGAQTSAADLGAVSPGGMSENNVQAILDALKEALDGTTTKSGNMPTGGAADQILVKRSPETYDARWQTPQWDLSCKQITLTADGWLDLAPVEAIVISTGAGDELINVDWYEQMEDGSWKGYSTWGPRYDIRLTIPNFEYKEGIRITFDAPEVKPVYRADGELIYLGVALFINGIYLAMMGKVTTAKIWGENMPTWEEGQKVTVEITGSGNKNLNGKEVAPLTVERVYGQPVSLLHTANSKVNLQPDADAIRQLMDDGVSLLYVENDNARLTAIAVDGAPTQDLTIQATVEEVNKWL